MIYTTVNLKNKFNKSTLFKTLCIAICSIIFFGGTRVVFFSEINVNIIDNITLVSQENNNACFPTVIEMILTYLKHPSRQCSIINESRPDRDCEDPANCKDCCEADNMHHPDCDQQTERTNILIINGIQSLPSSSPLNYDTLKSEISKSLPLIFHYRQTRPHVVVINGYADLDSNSYLAIKDPWKTGKGTSRFISCKDYYDSKILQYYNTFHKLSYGFSSK